MTDSPLGGRSRSNTGGESPLVGMAGAARHRSGPVLVRPQPVTEPSLMESVTGFINEVQSFNQPGTDPKTQVTWARFEQTDINDPSLYPDNHELNGHSLPLLLVLGYTQGVQAWLIPGSGEAQLVLSWFHGPVKCLKFLPSPECPPPFSDPYSCSRPLVAICDASGAGNPFMAVTFISLSTGEQVSNIKFSNEVADICVNRRVVCVAFREKIAVFSALTLRDKFTVTSCYPSPGFHSNPLALHDRWLAYADKTLCMSRRSFGGMEGDSNQSVTAWGINVGSKLASKIYSNIFSRSPPKATGGNHGTTEGDVGVVTILDIVSITNMEEERNAHEGLDVNNLKNGMVAHFVAHNKAIVALQWDSSGNLLLTADRNGNCFNVFRVVAHPLGSCYSMVQHLYILYRGDTPGSVQDVAFSPDSRWVTVSTLRGTTHIFPISPYGGQVGVRTHTSPRVVNKLSAFHRSAGLDDSVSGAGSATSASSGRNSPNPTLGSSPATKTFDFSNTMVGAASGLTAGAMGGGNSGLGGLGSAFHSQPYSSPIMLQPIAQLRQPYIVTITSSVTLQSNRKSKRNSVPDDIPIRLAVAFAPSRARMVPGLHSVGMFNRNTIRAHDSLYVMANHGQLLEYSLEVVPDQTLPRDKVCESSPIEMNVVTFGQWNLSKSAGKDRRDVAPPLNNNSPLLLTKEMLVSQERDIIDSEEDECEEDRWLSQVEIVTHVGPARRIWMGPQFSFKPFKSYGQEDDLSDLDVTVACRPRSEPMQMPGGGVFRPGSGQKPIFIECGSANSFELSPRFSNSASGPAVRGSQEQVHLDVESELREAMSDMSVGPQNRAESGKELRGPKRDRDQEEFFCLSTEDIREARSRSSSSCVDSKENLNLRSRHSSAATSRPVEMLTQDTKIFSVAVQEGKSITADKHVIYKDIEKEVIDRPVFISETTSKLLQEELENSEEEFYPVTGDSSSKLDPLYDYESSIISEIGSALAQVDKKPKNIKQREETRTTKDDSFEIMDDSSSKKAVFCPKGKKASSCSPDGQTTNDDEAQASNKAADPIIEKERASQSQERTVNQSEDKMTRSACESLAVETGKGKGKGKKKKKKGDRQSESQMNMSSDDCQVGNTSNSEDFPALGFTENKEKLGTPPPPSVWGKKLASPPPVTEKKRLASPSNDADEKTASTPSAAAEKKLPSPSPRSSEEKELKSTSEKSDISDKATEDKDNDMDEKSDDEVFFIREKSTDVEEIDENDQEKIDSVTRVDPYSAKPAFANHPYNARTGSSEVSAASGDSRVWSLGSSSGYRSASNDISAAIQDQINVAAMKYEGEEEKASEDEGLIEFSKEDNDAAKVPDPHSPHLLVSDGESEQKEDAKDANKREGRGSCLAELLSLDVKSENKGDDATLEAAKEEIGAISTPASIWSGFITKSSGVSTLRAAKEDSKDEIFYSSDDDAKEAEAFKPVHMGKRNRKKNRKQAAGASATGNSDASWTDNDRPRNMDDSVTDLEGWKDADSDAGDISSTSVDKTCFADKSNPKDGWSFEVDEIDVNNLLNQTAGDDKEERVALEDVFRFDSEMANSSRDADGATIGSNKKFHTSSSSSTASSGASGKVVSVEDLQDALKEEAAADEDMNTTEDSEAEAGTGLNNNAKGLRERKWMTDTSTDEEGATDSKAKMPGSHLSSSYPGTSSASESSVTNSPNPRSNTSQSSRNRKNKKKRR